MKTAPLPFAVTDGSGPAKRYVVIDNAGEPVVSTHGQDTQEADARRIALAVNVHETLIAALRTAHYEALTLYPRLSGAYQRNTKAVVDICAKALEAAGVRP